MYKIKRLLHIHIILIYFTYLYSHSYSSSCKQVHANEDSITTASDGMSKEQRELIMKQFAAMAQERLFKFKGKPNQGSSSTKLYVPRAILKQYIGYREDMRKFVPDDRDFLGDIKIDNLDAPREDIWTELSNNGGADLEVEMGPPDASLDERRFNVDGSAKHVAVVTLEREPEGISPKLEHSLPPHSRSVKSQRRFRSVHMKFNLSQEVYKGPSAADDLKGAELRLSRESIHDCEFHDCPKKPVRFFNHHHAEKSSSPSSLSGHDVTDATSDNLNRVNLVPRYQKVYILQVNGYDQFNEPQVTISSMRRIDTTQTSALIFNIKPIVKAWLLDPATNFGIIVRVTNDDEDYDLLAKYKDVARNHSGKREINYTDESGAETFIRPDFLDHVRLKRASHGTSDSAEKWRDIQPSLMLYSNPEEPQERYHVKRHYDESQMQADEPDSDGAQQRHSSTETSHGLVSKPSVTTASSHPYKPPTTSAGGRRSTQAVRASSNGSRASSQQQGSASRSSRGKPKPSVKQSDKCSKRQLNIKFDEVGWSSWIIAPHSFYANYCAGDCNWPLADAQNSTNHAIIQAIYKSVGRLVPKSSCAPVKYGRMAILYQLDGIVQMREYDDMIVEACGCL